MVVHGRWILNGQSDDSFVCINGACLYNQGNWKWFWLVLVQGGEMAMGSVLSAEVSSLRLCHAGWQQYGPNVISRLSSGMCLMCECADCISVLSYS